MVLHVNNSHNMKKKEKIIPNFENKNNFTIK